MRNRRLGNRARVLNLIFTLLARPHVRRMGEIKPPARRVELWGSLAMAVYLCSGLILLSFLIGNASAAELDAAPRAESARKAKQKVSNQTERSVYENFFATYFAIFDGPSLADPTMSYQPTAFGEPDPTRPVLLRNFLSLGYRLSEETSVNLATSLGWSPAKSEGLAMRDPYLRFSHLSLVGTENFNLSGDIRFHFPITFNSRMEDLLAGIQSFQMVHYVIPNSPITFGNFSSIRMNLYGDYGVGNSFEFYLAPHVTLQFLPNMALIPMLEFFFADAVHVKGFKLENTAIEFEPALSWDITQDLNFAPFISLPLKGKASLESTSFGFSMSWVII